MTGDLGCDQGQEGVSHDGIDLVHASCTADMAGLVLVKKSRDFLLFSEGRLPLGAAGMSGSFLLQFLNLLVKLASRLEAKGKSHRFPMASFKSEQKQWSSFTQRGRGCTCNLCRCLMTYKPALLLMASSQKEQRTGAGALPTLSPEGI